MKIGNFDKKATENAIMNYSKSQLKEIKKSLKFNSKPEKLVEESCMGWFKDFGFSMSVVESKAVWNNAARRYISGQTVSGFSDSAGCTPLGYASFIEFKALGKNNTLKDNQRNFLREKIIKGSFACVVDSKDLLEKHYKSWNALILDNEKDRAIAYLLSVLPKKK